MDELAQLNAALKANKISKAEFARECDKSYSWILTVLRGDFPYCGARCIPVNIHRVAARLQLHGRNGDTHEDGVTKEGRR